jgi:hypothetical protein
LLVDINAVGKGIVAHGKPEALAAWRFVPACSVIIYGLIAEETIMEAERLNSLSALLADLTAREAELRRYL